MTAIDVIYDEFLKFLEEYGITESFRRGCARKGYTNFDNKELFYIHLNNEVINHSLVWRETPITSNYEWSDIHRLWSRRYTELIDKIDYSSLEPVTVYAVPDNYSFLDPLIRINCVYLRYASSLLADNYNNVNTKTIIATLYDTSIIDKIILGGGKIKLEQLTEKDFITCSNNVYDLLQCVSLLGVFVLALPYKEIIRNYIDVDTETGRVSYLPSTKQSDDPWHSTSRQKTSIGRLLKQLDVDNLLDNCEIEKISNFFSSLGSNLNIQVWDSPRIPEAYLEDNYANKLGCINSVLHNSCMRYDRCQPYMQFYVKAKAKIVVVLNPENKILARALLWKISNKDNVYYLDRIYSVSPFYVMRVVNYVKQHYNIEYYRIDRDFKSAKTNSDVFPEELIHYRIFSEDLKNYEGPYPYLDTFPVFNYREGTLQMKYDIKMLHSTGGSYSD